MFPVNQVFKVSDRSLRLLWWVGEQGYWIDIDDQKAWPEPISVSELERMLIDKAAERVEDRFLGDVLREVEPDSVHWLKREKAWEMIGGEVSNPNLFSPKGRGSAVKRIMSQHGVTHQTVYRLLRRYWQRGMCENALLPDYHRSGGKGKRKTPANKKLGRPRSITDGTGCNITHDLERIFRQVIEEKLLKEKNTSVADAHARSLNVIRAMTPNVSDFELPTVEQFRFYYKREYGLVEVIEKQTSPVNFAKDIRPIISSSTAESLGPGHRFQIDATIGDIYLLSEYDRSRIVGRPVVYFVVDVFSRMVVGMYIGFEGPSWVSAMMALANTVESKAKYCARFDIDIDEEEWPARGLPDVLLADKGEINGTKVEPFSRGHGVRIENAPARRGDAKGIVERYFKTIQDKFKPYTPGVVEPVTSKKRGGHDYRQDATLTLYEFTQKIILSVLWHNNHRVIRGYDRAEDLPSDLPAVPLQLWNWGIGNITGKLRTAPEELVNINLMPHDKAELSERGINLFGCFYTCQETLKLGWFHRKKGKRPDKILVSYDPRCADQIYIRPSKNLKDYWVCNLSDLSRRFRGMSFWDVWSIQKKERAADSNARVRSAVARGELIAESEAIVDQAKALKPTSSGISSRDLGHKVRQNKQDEKRIERENTAFKPKSDTKKSKADVVPLHGGSEPVNYDYPDMVEELFEDDDDE